MNQNDAFELVKLSVANALAWFDIITVDTDGKVYYIYNKKEIAVAEGNKLIWSNGGTSKQQEALIRAYFNIFCSSD